MFARVPVRKSDRLCESTSRAALVQKSTSGQRVGPCELERVRVRHARVCIIVSVFVSVVVGLETISSQSPISSFGSRADPTHSLLHPRRLSHGAHLPPLRPSELARQVDPSGQPHPTTDRRRVRYHWTSERPVLVPWRWTVGCTGQPALILADLARLLFIGLASQVSSSSS